MQEVGKVELDDKLTFGIEFETNEVALQILDKHVEKFNELASAGSWCSKPDYTVKNGGEIASSILTDDFVTWLDIEDMCEMLKELGAKPSSKAAFHVHFNADFYEKGNNKWLNLLQLWLLYEPVFYYFSFNLIQCGRPELETFARPLRKNYQQYIKLIEYFSSFKYNLEEAREIYPQFFEQYSAGEEIDSLIHKFQGMNIANVLYNKNITAQHDIFLKSRKPTIEFRTADSTFEIMQIKVMVSLFGRLLEKSKNIELDIDKLIIDRSDYEKKLLKLDYKQHRKPNYKLAEELFNLLARDSKEEELYMKQYQKRL